jgi:hypothetical protein
MGFTWAASKGRFNSQYSMRPGDRKRFAEWQRADVPFKLKAIDNCFS